MTFGALKLKVCSPEMAVLVQKSRDYSLLGEFYESKTNAQGGKDYICKELEKFLLKGKEGDEFHNLKDHSNDLTRMEGISILTLNISKKAYLQENYDKYRFYVKISKMED